MQLLNGQIGDIAHLIEIASRNPLAAIVAPVVLAWLVAYIYFGKGRSPKDPRLLKYRFAVFVLALLGTVATGRLVVSLQRLVTYVGGSQTAMQPLRTPQLGNQAGGQNRLGKSKVDSNTGREFASQIAQARKYSRLTDYARACEIYSAAFGSLPSATLNNMEHGAVYTEAKKCGKGQSQEAVERLDGIAMRFTVD